MAKRVARADGLPENNAPEIERRGPGRPKKRRVDDGRVIYQHPSALARAADHACLSHLARFTLDHETLERADRYNQRTVHWGGERSIMLLKNLPPAANRNAVKVVNYYFTCFRPAF